MSRYALDRAFYYLATLLPLSVTLFAMMALVSLYPAPAETTLMQHLIGLGKFFWLSGIIFVGTNLAGFVLYGSPLEGDHRNLESFNETGWDTDRRLVVAYVSRGDNHQALDRALTSTLAILNRSGANFKIEVVTDMPVPHLKVKGIDYHVVPKGYRTKNGAKYKARAVHYLLGQREITMRGYDWILHMDEESIITSEALAGIYKFITDPKNERVIGQGEIKYNSYRYGTNWLITAMDAVRTGDDLGRFRLQYKLFHRPIFGMHGSFILVPKEVEDAVGFDLGGKGSITEDAYFALIAYERGFKFDWVEGFIREQSPFDLVSLVKQRRRWFCGLVLLAFDPMVSLRTRSTLLLNMAMWAISWVGPVVAILNLIDSGSPIPLVVALAAAAILGGIASVYLVGSYRNLKELEMPRHLKLAHLFLSVALVPVASAIEGAAIVYALANPVRTFDVINKN